MTTLYEILEINQSATLEEIKQARDRLAKKWHPDKNNNSEESKIKFQKIQEAYEILSDLYERSGCDNPTGSAQQWLDSNFPKQKFSSQGSSTYTTLSTGKRVYNDPSEEVINPRLNFFSLDISNRNLEGPLKLEGFNNLEKLDLSGNKITDLDLDSYSNLRVISCDNNPLNSLKFRNSAMSSNPFTVEISFSQSELIGEKEEFKSHARKLSEQVSDLEKEKNFLDKQIVELKKANEKDRKSFGRQVDELEKKNEIQIKNVESDYQSQIKGLEIKYNEEIRWNRSELEGRLSQEQNNVRSLTDSNNFLERKLKERENELQRLDQSLSISESQVYNLRMNLKNKENELKSTLLTSQLEVGQINDHVSSLESKNSSLQEKITQLKNQLKNLKMQSLEKQKSELSGLVVNAGKKIGALWQDKLDDLIGSHEELNKNSSNSYIQRQFEKVKEELTKKLGEEEIANILAKQEEIWKLQLELLNESSRVTVMESLERDIDKQKKHFEELLDSAKDKTKSSKLSIKVGKGSSKDDDYQLHLKEFLELQELITRSNNDQKICSYLSERQSHLRQKILAKKKLDDKELREICLVKEELAKLEIQKSILVGYNYQEYQSQIQVPPQVPSKK